MGSNYVLQRTPGTSCVSTNHRGPAPLTTALAIVVMLVEFSPSSFLEVSYGAGTAGTGDLVLGLRLRCEGASGDGRPYFERAGLEAFLGELGGVLNGSCSEASTSSDNSDASISVIPLDALGHYGLVISLSFPIHHCARSLPCSVVGSFQLEFSQVQTLCNELGKALRADG